MPNIIIREGLVASRRVTGMSEPAQLFYVLLLLKIDDFGCFDAHPTLLRAACYPYRIDEKTDDQIRGYLDECAKAGVIQLYSGDGKECLYVDNFKQQTRQKHRKYPVPPKIDSDIPSNGSRHATQPATHNDKQASQQPDTQLSSSPCTIRTPLSYSEGLVGVVVGIADGPSSDRERPPPQKGKKSERSGRDSDVLTKEQIEGMSHSLTSKFHNPEVIQSIFQWYNYLRKEHPEHAIDSGPLSKLIARFSRYDSAVDVINEIDETISHKGWRIWFNNGKGRA